VLASPRVALSKAQIDKLGERLKAGHPSAADLRELDDYRRSFSAAYETVISVARFGDKEPTGRAAKSTSAIIDKLRRETIRLSQIQDIAGCRVVVPDIFRQELVVIALTDPFPGSTVINRRARSSHGYRAVHVVVTVNDRVVEIQVRTELQQKWAELSEKFADRIDPAIKYGGGKGRVQGLLLSASSRIAEIEELEQLAPELETFPEPDERYRLEVALQDLKAQVNTDLEALMQQLDALKREATGQ
jgi:putative GTP pyrophosphokinase